VFGHGVRDRSIDVRACHSLVDVGADHHRDCRDFRRKIAFMADADEMVGKP
jgi:hypothetical protein